MRNSLFFFNIKSYFLSFAFFIICLFLLKENIALYTVPVFLSTLLLLNLIFIALRNGSTIFHPLPITCVIMLWALVYSPVFSQYTQTYLAFAPRSINWEKWNLVISWLYFFGILLFYFTIGLLYKKPIIEENKKTICFSRKSLLKYAFLFLSISFFAQVFIYIKFGGIYGYMTSWTEDRDQFKGFGIYYLLAEPFPILFVMTSVLYIGKEKLKKSLFIIVILFLVFFILKMFFGGLRGSRSNTIWGLFWFAGIIHLFVYRIKAYQYIFALVFIGFFMSGYSLYKSYGVNVFSQNYSIVDSERYEKNPYVEMLLGDFSRATVNAFQVAQIKDYGSYDVKLGQTYIYALSMLLPFKLNIYSKNDAGSEIIHNQNLGINSEQYKNSRVFGLYGEGILNFGIYFALFSFVFLGFIVSRLEYICSGIRASSPYILLVPFISNLSFQFVVSDLDNIIFFIFKNGFLPFLFIFLISKKSFLRN